MRVSVALIVTAMTVLGVTGCGGNSDQPTVTPAAKQWATKYCTSLASLQTPAEESAKALQAGGIETPAQAQTTFAPVGAATTAFADDMANLPPTGTPGAAEVKQQTDSLASTIKKYVKEAQASLAAWKAGVGTQTKTLSLVGSQLRAVHTTLGSTTATIRNVDDAINAAMSESTECLSLTKSLNS